MQRRAPCGAAGAGVPHTHKSLFIHTQRLPRRPAEETNTGKEENCGALPLSRQGEVAASTLRDHAQGHVFVFFFPIFWGLQFHTGRL